MRLNKYLALCGLGSRRAVEQLITEGQVMVGGRTVTDLATQVDEAADRVTVQGQAVRPVAHHNFDYIMLNKPRGYDVTRGGRHHHRRAWDLLPKETHPSVQSVGRLDRNSTGLLLFTNDGELAFRLTHPRYGCRKVYEVELEGKITPLVAGRLTEGVELEDGLARAISVECLPNEPEAPAALRIVMEEGRNRIVRRMCEAIGHPTISLNRSAMGPLQLGDLPRGKTRLLTTREIHLLRKAVGLVAPPKAPAPEEPARQPRRHTPSSSPRPHAPAGRGRAPRANAPRDRPPRGHKPGRRGG